jgi:hypothetical protein
MEERRRMAEVTFHADVPEDPSRGAFTTMFDSMNPGRADRAFVRFLDVNPSVVEAVTKHGFDVAGSISQAGRYTSDEMRATATAALFEAVKAVRDKGAPVAISSSHTGYLVRIGGRKLGEIIRSEYSAGGSAARQYQKVRRAEEALARLLNGREDPSMQEVLDYVNVVDCAKRGISLLSQGDEKLIRASDVTGDRAAAKAIRRTVRESVLAHATAARPRKDLTTEQRRRDAVLAYNRELFDSARKRAESALAAAYRTQDVLPSVRYHMEAAVADVVESGLLARPSDLLPDSSGFDWDAESDALRENLVAADAERLAGASPVTIEDEVHSYLRRTILDSGEADLTSKSRLVTREDFVLKTERELAPDSALAESGRQSFHSQAPLADPLELERMQARALDAAANQVADPVLKVVVLQVVALYLAKVDTQEEASKAAHAEATETRKLVPLHIDETSGREQVPGADIGYSDTVHRANDDRRGFFSAGNMRSLREAFRSANVRMPDGDALERLTVRATELALSVIRRVTDCA